jgi:hypothetical protein
MAQLTLTYPNIIQSLDNLKILVFWEILKSKNPKLLDLNYMPDKEYTAEEEEFIVHTWELLYDSYYQVKEDSKSKLVLDKQFNVMMLEFQINQFIHYIKMWEHLDSVKELLELKMYTEYQCLLIRAFNSVDSTLNLNLLDSTETNIKRIERRLFALQAKHKRIADDNKKEIDKQVDNVFSVIVRVARITESKLDAHSMVVTEWLAWEKEAKEVLKANKEASEKNKNRGKRNR